LFSGESPLESFQLFLSFAVVPWVVYGIALGVSQEALETHINTNFSTGWNMLYFTLGLDSELARVAIGTTDDTNPFDVFDRKGPNLLFLVSDQPESAYATPISEGDMFAIGLEFPPGLLVLNTPVIMLKLGIAFLAWLVVFAILIEVVDSEPSTVSTRLTSLRIETSGKGILFGKDGTIALKIVLVDTALIHPQAHALVADELHHANGLIESSILPAQTVQLVLVDEHPPLALSLSFSYTTYTAINGTCQERKQMRRSNVYLTEKQVARLRARAEQEGVAIAELIRRAVDAFLAWDDPTYTPQPKPQTRKASSSPA